MGRMAFHLSRRRESLVAEAAHKLNPPADPLDVWPVLDFDVLRTTYELSGASAELLTLGELCALDKKPVEFSIKEVSNYYGSIGIIPSDWTTSTIDWYRPRVELVSVRHLQKGKVTIAGPFKYLRSSEEFVVLESATGECFCHPKYLKKSSNYCTTAAWVWASRCLCENEDEDMLSVHCCCSEIFGRTFCLTCGVGTGVHDKVASLHPDEVDEALSQNLCICADIFSNHGECFYGFQRSSHENAGTSEVPLDDAAESGKQWRRSKCRHKRRFGRTDRHQYNRRIRTQHPRQLGEQRRARTRL
ncbi:hypothetical protein R1sor_007140 [Riccia sorocarpa]|uniref:Uncharacterized protein n=1 Tax=Riccia sorocarpa TaxID=122646 RepID=A0ABD3HSC4_9MARC